MTLGEFQHLARLYVLGALEAEERDAFEAGRELFGAEAESYIADCRRMESAFALSLQPRQPPGDAKERLMRMIRDANQRSSHSAS